jgi:1,4-dihydroxy-2-naphthoyl-CoA hydrolase
MIARCSAERRSNVANVPGRVVCAAVSARKNNLSEAAPAYAVPFEQTLDGVLGFEVVEIGDETARARLPVSDKVRQPFGLLHGGAYAALAESLASAATFQAVANGGNIAVGSSNNTSFFRPVTEGVVNAEGRARHRGRSQWVWDVDFTDEHGRLTATSRVTIAVRPRPGTPPRSDS